MKITKLKLTNFGKHNNLEYSDLDNKSIIGIIGKNGSGKSTIISAIDFAFTGRLEDKADSYIKSGETNASIELEFEKNGRKGFIKRKLSKTTSSRSFKWEDEEIEYTKASDVDNKLIEILGADKQVLSNTIFIKQGELSSILDNSKSKRIDLFTKLLNLDYFNKRHYAVDVAQKDLKTKVVDIEKINDDILLKEKSFNEHKENVLNITKSLEKYVSKKFIEDLKTKVEKYIKIVESIFDKNRELADLLRPYSNYEDLKSKIEDVKNKIEINNNLRSSLDKKINNIESSICLYERYNEYNSLLESKKLVEVRLEELIKTYPKLNDIQYLDDYKNKINLNSKLEQANDKYNKYIIEKSNIESSIQTLEIEVKPIEEKLIELSSQREESKKVISNLELLLDTKIKLKGKLNNKSTTCPICGLKIMEGQVITDQDINNLKDLITNLTSKLSILENEYNSTDALLFSKNTSIRLNKDKILELDGLINKELEFIKSNNKSEVTEEEYTSLVIANSSYNRFIKEIEEFKNKLDSYNNISEQDKLDLSKLDINLLKENRKTYYSELTSLNDESRNLLNNQAIYNNHLVLIDKTIGDLHSMTKEQEEIDIDADLNKCEELKSYSLEDLINYKLLEINKLFNDLEIKNIALSEEEKALISLKEYKNDLSKKNEKIYNLIAELEEVKLSINPKEDSSIPKLYIKYLFSHILENVSEYLDLLDANFIIDSDYNYENDELSFRFKRLDTSEESDWMPMNKLSGGQKVKLSTAFLISIQKVICPDIGFLVLDEPTTHLDENSVDALKTFISELGNKLKGQIDQIWIIDHNISLGNYCDKTINLN